MTRKSIERLVDGILQTACDRAGLVNAPAVKGGMAEIPQGRLYEVIRDQTEAILTLMSYPAPVAPQETPAAPAGWGEIAGGPEGTSDEPVGEAA